MHWSYQFILWQISHLSRIFDNHLIHVLNSKLNYIIFVNFKLRIGNQIHQNHCQPLPP